MQSRAGKDKPPQHCSSNPQRAPTYSCHRCAQPSLPTLNHCCCFQQWGVPVQHGDTESLPEQTPGANDETFNPRPKVTRTRTNGAQGQNKNTPAMPPPKQPRNLDGEAVKKATAAATAAAAAATTSTNKHTRARQGQGSTPIPDHPVRAVLLPLKIAGSRAPATILWEDGSDGTLVLQCLKACPPGTDIEVRDAGGDKVDTYQVPLALDEGAKVQIKFNQGYKFMQGQGNLQILDPDWQPPARNGTATLPTFLPASRNVHFHDTATEAGPPASAAATQGRTKSGAAAAGNPPGVAQNKPRRGAKKVECEQDMHIQALNEVAKKALGQNLQLGASSSNKTPQLDMFMRCISLFDVYDRNWRDSPPPPGVLKKLNRECLHGICTQLMADVDPAKVWQHHSHPSCSTHRHKHSTCHPPMQAHAPHSTHPAPQPCRHLLTGKVMDVTCKACTTTHGDS